MNAYRGDKRHNINYYETSNFFVHNSSCYFVYLLFY